MAIRVKARSGETTEQMLRRFKKLCEKEGLQKDIRRKEFYEKPSERRRRAARKSINRRLKDEFGTITGRPTRGPGGPGGPGGGSSGGGGGRRSTRS